jgi:methyltransferase (TIGR00027 family)
LRQGAELGDLLVYEVDDPPFLEWKRERIAAHGFVEPPQLRYVPCDFEVTSLPEALAASDFDPDRPCFISWLGVTQYLTPEAALATLSWAGARPPGSEIIVTFMESNDLSGVVGASLMEKVGTLTFYSPDEMTKMLKQAGFSRLDYMGEERANETYFRDRKDGLAAPKVQRLVSAIV